MPPSPRASLTPWSNCPDRRSGWRLLDSREAEHFRQIAERLGELGTALTVVDGQ